MKREQLELFISNFPIYQYHFFSPSEITFSDRIRIICKQECERYHTTWACPPAVGSVDGCKDRCLQYKDAFFFSTVSEVDDICNMEELLKTRKEHEDITNQIERFVKGQDVSCYTLSTESCDICEQCTYPDAPCRFPEKMHPCVESHGIVVTQLAENFDMDYAIGMNQILWFGIIFINLAE